MGMCLRDESTHVSPLYLEPRFLRAIWEAYDRAFYLDSAASLSGGSSGRYWQALWQGVMMASELHYAASLSPWSGVRLSAFSGAELADAEDDSWSACR